MMGAVSRAFGKVILFGEHAVVYGVPAIAAGIEPGASARAVAALTSSLRVGERCTQSGDGSELAAALQATLGALGLGPHAVEVQLSLPPGAGLGASAAMGVAVARALLKAAGQAPEPARVLAAAAAWEGVFHGNASGVDAAAAAEGGCIFFERGKEPRTIPVGRALKLVVALAGPPASTRSMVESVRQLKERRPAIVDQTFDGIRALVQNARLCIEAGDLPALGSLMDLNQMLLSGLFVSTEGIERACSIARAAGALGAKLTGAGGGGAVIALSENDATPILEALRAEGLVCFATAVPQTETGIGQAP